MSSRSHPSPKRPGGKREGHSKYVGVTWHRQDQKWQAAIKIEGKSMHLGHFLDEDEAARKYDEYAGKLGRNVNFPDEVNAKLKERGDNGTSSKSNPPPVPLGQAKKGVFNASSKGRSSTSSKISSRAKKSGRNHSQAEKKSEYIGVTWNRRAEKWEVRLYSGGRNTYLGSFENKEDAARMYDKHAILYGKTLNFPDEKTAEMDDEESMRALKRLAASPRKRKGSADISKPSAHASSRDGLSVERPRRNRTKSQRALAADVSLTAVSGDESSSSEEGSVTKRIRSMSDASHHHNGSTTTSSFHDQVDSHLKRSSHIRDRSLSLASSGGYNSGRSSVIDTEAEADAVATILGLRGFCNQPKSADASGGINAVLASIDTENSPVTRLFPEEPIKSTTDDSEVIHDKPNSWKQTKSKNKRSRVSSSGSVGSENSELKSSRSQRACPTCDSVTYNIQMTKELQQDLLKLLHQLMKHEKSYYFRKPVHEYSDLDESFIETYSQLVKHPMNLRSIRVKLLGRNAMLRLLPYTAKTQDLTLHLKESGATPLASPFTPYALLPLSALALTPKARQSKLSKSDHETVSTSFSSTSPSSATSPRQSTATATAAVSSVHMPHTSLPVPPLSTIHTGCGYANLGTFIDDLETIWWNAEQFNEKSSPVVAHAKLLKKESRLALQSLRTIGKFEDISGFIDWNSNHELMGKKLIDDEGSFFHITGWLKASTSGEAELWQGSYAADPSKEFVMDRSKLDKCMYYTNAYLREIEAMHPTIDPVKDNTLGGTQVHETGLGGTQLDNVGVGGEQVGTPVEAGIKDTQMAEDTMDIVPTISVSAATSPFKDTSGVSLNKSTHKSPQGKDTSKLLSKSNANVPFTCGIGSAVAKGIGTNQQTDAKLSKFKASSAASSGANILPRPPPSLEKSVIKDSVLKQSPASFWSGLGTHQNTHSTDKKAVPLLHIGKSRHLYPFVHSSTASRGTQSQEALPFATEDAPNTTPSGTIWPKLSDGMSLLPVSSHTQNMHLQHQYQPSDAQKTQQFQTHSQYSPLLFPWLSNPGMINSMRRRGAQHVIHQPTPGSTNQDTSFPSHSALRPLFTSNPMSESEGTKSLPANSSLATSGNVPLSSQGALTSLQSLFPEHEVSSFYSSTPAGDSRPLMPSGWCDSGSGGDFSYQNYPFVAQPNSTLMSTSSSSFVPSLVPTTDMHTKKTKTRNIMKSNSPSFATDSGKGVVKPVQKQKSAVKHNVFCDVEYSLNDQEEYQKNLGATHTSVYLTPNSFPFEGEPNQTYLTEHKIPVSHITTHDVEKSEENDSPASGTNPTGKVGILGGMLQESERYPRESNISLTCECCFKSKVKCDKEFPVCGRCDRLGLVCKDQRKKHQKSFRTESANDTPMSSGKSFSHENYVSK